MVATTTATGTPTTGWTRETPPSWCAIFRRGSPWRTRTMETPTPAMGRRPPASCPALPATAPQALEGAEGAALITFHDGFHYFAQALGLPLLASIEEEEGSEASAMEINEITQLVKEHQLPRHLHRGQRL